MKLKSIYMVTEQYDTVTTLNAPDGAALAKAILASTGSITIANLVGLSLNTNGL